MTLNIKTQYCVLTIHKDKKEIFKKKKTRSLSGRQSSVGKSDFGNDISGNYEKSQSQLALQAIELMMMMTFGEAQ